MKFVERITGMFTKPDDTTKDIANEPRIEEALLIVGIYMVLLVISAYLSFTHIKLTGQIPGAGSAMSLSTYADILLITSIVGTMIMALVGWPIIAGVAHLLSMFFGGAGKLYPGVLTLIGYTALPLIIVTIIGILLSFMMPVNTVDLSGGTSAISTSKQSLSDPITILGLIVTLAGSIWVAFMMSFAIKNGEKVSMNNAYIVVGVLFIANFVITFGSVILLLVS